MHRLSVQDLKKEFKKKSRATEAIDEDVPSSHNEYIYQDVAKAIHKLSSVELVELKALDGLISESNLQDGYEEIIARLSTLNPKDLLNYKRDETQETYLHLVVNRSKSNTSEALLLKIFEKLVDSGCDLNAVDSYGWSCLHYCCVNKFNEIASFIVDYGTSPIQICAWLNNLPLAKTLTAHGANLLERNESGWTCMHICARQAHLDFLRFLINRECNVNIGNNHKKTPLHVASRHGHVEIAEALLKAKANLSLVNNYGYSALYVAVVNKHLGVIKILIEHGVDTNQVDVQQSTALHALAQLKEGANESESNRIIQIGELLMRNGADPTRINYLGRNPLHYCAKTNSSNLASFLIKHSKILINSRDFYNQTPLFIACKNKSLETLKTLLNSKANKDIADLTGKTPIHLFADIEHDTDTSLQYLSILLEHGDDINKATVDNERQTPLHVASRNNNVNFVKILIQLGADINKTSEEGATALHLACEEGAYETCVSLLEHGAKITKTNRDGHTPLHASLFARFNSQRIASLLIEHGSSINQEDNDKITPIVLATLLGNLEVVQLLADRKASVFNSDRESVAHVAANKNQCDTKCLQLLIANYGFVKLFSEANHNQTPMQLCVLNKSQNFLQSLIACDNITCLNWFKSLHSIRGLGVSPLIMAATSQNYEFIRDLIAMWFKLFHDDHHNINHKHNNFIRSSNKCSGWIKKLRALFDKSHEYGYDEQEIYTVNDKLSRTHGCSFCRHDNCCLFKPDWNDKEQEYGKYFLNVLIRENPQIALEILNTFLKADILKWQIYVFLDHLEPCENLMLNDLDKNERPLTPLETIFFENKLAVVTHPVVKALIKEKLNSFGRFSLIFDTIRQICLLIVWTAFVCCEDYSIRHCYTLGNSTGKIVLLILSILFFLWDASEECIQIYFIHQRVVGYRTWLKNTKLKTTSSFLSLKSDSSIQDESLEKQRDDFLLIDKDIRALDSMKSPYKRIDNLIDWLAILFQILTLITHFVDMCSHTDQTARVHTIVATLNCIGIWLRQLLMVNGLVPSASLVCMLRLMGANIIRFAFLYIRIYIPFCLLFWSLFSGTKISEKSMQANYRECEYLTYGVPYQGPYSKNISLYSSSLNNPFNCTTVSVGGFENFYDSLYSTFRFLVVDNYDFDNMKQVHYVLSPIICSIFIVLSAIIGLNFFVGLITSILSDGAYTAVESHKLMELLGYVLQQEWRLRKIQRQKHLDHIRKCCAPKVIKDNKEVIETIHATTSQSQAPPSIILPNDIESKILDLEYKIEKKFMNNSSTLTSRTSSNNNQHQQQQQQQQQQQLIINTNKRQQNINEDSNHQLAVLKNDIKEMKTSLNEIRNFLLKNSLKK